MKGKTIWAIYIIALIMITAGYSSLASAKVDYKQQMVRLVKEINLYAENKNSAFQVITNNGIDLLDSKTGKTALSKEFINNIDGLLLESYYYGWDMQDDAQSPASASEETADQLSLLKAANKAVFSVDYCREPSKVAIAHAQAAQQGIVPFAASSRQLDSIPSYPTRPTGENLNSITSLQQAKNLLVLLNPQHFKDKAGYLAALQNTNYDLLIIDAYYNDTPLSIKDVNSLKVKKNGAVRLVYAYMSVGEAEDYRSYWDPTWSQKPPSWLAAPNADWPGNYKVKYWDRRWKSLLYGSPSAYLDGIMAAGFNGVFLDVVDAYQYFQSN